MTNLCCECVRDAKRMKRDERYFSRYIIEYIVICNTCFKWNSQAAIISRSFSRIDKRKLATRWKSADSILTSVVAHRLNDNEHTFEYPRENLNEHRCSFSFLRIFLLLPFERRKRLSSSLRGSHERLVITRYSRRNWSELLIFFYFYDAITATSNSIDPSTKLPALALFTLSLLQTNFQRSDFVAKKM